MAGQIITSSLLIAAVIIVRQISGKYISQRFVYSLWLIVAIKLLVPFSFENPFLFTSIFRTGMVQQVSLKNSPTYTQQDNITGNNAGYGSPAAIPAQDNTIKKALPDSRLQTGINTYTAEKQVKNIPVKDILILIWISGIILTGGIILASNIVFYNKLKKDRQSWQKYKTLEVYTTSCIGSPCLYGLFSPAIYIPGKWEMSAQQQKFIFLHEWVHYKHKDTLWAFTRYLCLSIYWFNPLVWLAGYLSKKDCETACDETVTAISDTHERALYGRILVDMCGLASDINHSNLLIQKFKGGNKEMKRRLKFIIKKNHPVSGIMILSGVIMLCAAGCTFGQNKNPTTKTAETVSSTSNTKKQDTETTKSDNTSGPDKSNNEDNADNTGNAISLDIAQMDLTEITGPDGAMLYYADPGKIIFSSSGGLFVYDTKNRKMLRSVDLKKIGCAATQGDNCCFINVSKDGTTVYLHKVNSDKMYVYDVANNNITKTGYNKNKMKKIFPAGRDSFVQYSHDGRTIQVCLRNEWIRTGQLAYEYNNEGFARYIFVPDEYKNVEILQRNDLVDIKKIEIFTKGKIYSCESEEACKYLEEHMKNAEPLRGGVDCPFYNEMFITLGNGEKGVIYPATDSCNIIKTAGSYFKLSDSDNKEFWKLLGWDLEDFIN